MTDISSQTLHIVAKELAATLNDARASLEAYAERSDQRELLEKCADQLHSAHGVLRLVEVYGAALLAEEMEHVTRYLLSSGNDQKRQVDGPRRPDARDGSAADLSRTGPVGRPGSGAGAAAAAQRSALRARQSPALRGNAAAAEPEVGSAGAAAVAAPGRASHFRGAVGQAAAAAVSARLARVYPRRARRAESGDSGQGGGKSSNRSPPRSPSSSCGGSSAPSSRRFAPTAWRAAPRSNACWGRRTARSRRCTNSARPATVRTRPSIC